MPSFFDDNIQCFFNKTFNAHAKNIIRKKLT